MNRIAHFVIACASFAVLGLSGAAQGDPGSGFANAITQARESAWKAITSGQGSGLSIAIMERGAFVFSEAIGAADRATNRAVDRDTRFNIGSVSKTFAAVAILLLVDDGKVQLDAPLTRYIPDFTMADRRYRQITVRMLLNHSAGLPAVIPFFGFERDNTAQAVLLDTLKRATLKHDPGAMSLYCNDCFTLAEIVVERVSGRQYMDWLAERIFLPLGMAHTGPSVGEIRGDGSDNVAEYYDAKSGKKYPHEILSIYAAGALSSTAEDLCRFGNALIPGGRQLLSPASLGELLRPQPTLRAGTMRHAEQFAMLGWDYSMRIGGPVDGMLVLSKGGNTGFYSANLQILPAQGIVVAAITSGQANADKLTQPILVGLLQDRKLAAAAGPVAHPPPAQAIPATLDRYAGYYAFEIGIMKLSIDRSRRKFTLTTMGSQAPPLALTYNDGYLYGPSAEYRFYFMSAQGGDFVVTNTTGLVTYDSVTLQKLAPVRSPPTLEVPMDNEPWLIRNAPASTEFYESTRPMVTSRAYKELPGYVDLLGVRRIERPDLAVIAATALRDQNDLALVRVDGEIWTRAANVLRSPASKTPPLTSGSASVTIGAEGYNEWRAVAQGMILRFDLPGARTRVAVVAADTTLYDSLVDGNEVYAPEGSYLFFAGAPGDTLRVTEVAAAATAR
jgi:CubicO group peptidase (beta-lactamase class C family)